MPIPFILPQVKPSVVKLYGDLCYFFPELTHFYGYAETPDHVYKRCLDAMVYDSSGLYVAQQGRKNLPYGERIALGDRVLAFLRKNADHYGLNGVIWDRKVYGFPHDDAPFGRNYYRGPYNVARPYTASAHDDHLHIDQDGSDFKSLIPDTPFVWDGTSFPGADRFYLGATGDYVTWLGQRLVAHGWTGYSDGPGPTFTTVDQAGVKWAQQQQGFTGADADGIPGATTWAWLAAEPEYPMPTSGEVYLDKLKPGVKDSDSVAYIQTWLAKILGIPLRRTGDYDEDTIASGKKYQSEGLGDAPQYCDGILGQLQTIELAKAAGAKVKIYADSVKGGLVYPKA